MLLEQAKAQAAGQPVPPLPLIPPHTAAELGQIDQNLAQVAPQAPMEFTIIGGKRST
jgi:hypothetical protein